MPATLVGTCSGSNGPGAITADTTVTCSALAGVQVGDQIVVSGMSWFNNAGDVFAWFASDDLGNIYTERVWLAGPGAFKEIHVWTSKVTVAGNPTITLQEIRPAGPTPKNAIGSCWRGAGDFDQATAYLANYTPADPSWLNGCGTGDVSYADTLVVSFMNYPDGAADPFATVRSVTGDTSLGGVTGWPCASYMFYRESTGPGNGKVELEANRSGDNTLVAVSFSKPLARPGGTLTQYAVRGGAGFQNQVAPFSDNRPLTISMPYQPVVGALAAVGIGQQVAALTGLTLTDNAGNVWTQGPTDNTHSNITVFTTTITAVPSAGIVWQLTLSGTPNVLTTIYQSTEIGVVEVLPPNGFTLGAITFATYLTQTGGGLSVQAFTSAIPNVPANSYLIAWAIASGVDNGTVTWTPLESYVLQQHWDFTQYIGEKVNRYRLGVMALLTKIAPALGSYDASVQLDAQETSSTLGGNILLLAVSLNSSLTLACPVGGGSATVGTAYSGALVVTGGTGPFTFAITVGALPPGITLNASTGVLSGIPTAAGSYNYTVRVTDSLGTTATASCTIAVTGPSRYNTLRWQIDAPGRPGRWFAHKYHDKIRSHYIVEPSASAPNDQQLYLLGATSAIMLSGGSTDNGSDLNTFVLVPSNDLGDERTQKLYPDAMLQLEGLGNLSASPAFNNAEVFAPATTINVSGPVQQSLVNIASLSNLALYRNIGVALSWTGGPEGPRVLAWEPAAYLQPYISRFLVTQFINLSYPGWKSHRRLYPALISTAPVIFTIQCQDGRTFQYTIPSTGGQFLVIPMIVDHGVKDLAFAYQLDGQGVDFALFPDAFTIESKGWPDPEFLDLAIYKT